MAASTMVKEGNPDINFEIATIQTNWGGDDSGTWFAGRCLYRVKLSQPKI